MVLSRLAKTQISRDIRKYDQSLTLRILTADIRMLPVCTLRIQRRRIRYGGYASLPRSKLGTKLKSNTKTRLFNILRFFTDVKNENFQMKISIYFVFLLKT